MKNASFFHNNASFFHNFVIIYVKKSPAGVVFSALAATN